MKRIIAQARKELTQILRDRLALALALVLPVVLLVLIGSAISLTVTDLPVVVQDFDQTPLSRRYAESFRTSLTLRVVSLPDSLRPEEALDASQARAAVIIPQNFERDIRRGRDTEVQVLIDASDANTANVLRGNAAAITQNFVNQLRAAEGGAGAPQPAIRAQTRLWYNPGRDSRRYIVPGTLVVALALFPPLLSALAMSREADQKTILQVYVSSISAHEFLLGKVFAYMIVAAVEWLLMLVVIFTFFGLRLTGDPVPMLAGTLLFLFATVSFGVLIGVAIPNQAAAIQAVQLGGFILSFLLSGFIFPVSNIPAGLRWISAIVPARYLIEVVRDAFVRGGGWAAEWRAVVLIACLGAVLYYAAWLRMRRMQVDA